jgi:LysM repeat protein
MFEIDHQKARALLQAAADRTLSEEEKSALDAHLAECKDCSNYAENLTKLEAQLHKVFHAQWNHQRPVLNIQSVVHPSRRKLVWNTLFGQTHVLEKVTIVAALLLGYVVIANLFGIRVPIGEQDTPTTVPTPNQLSFATVLSPTPSAHFTLTGMATNDCETVHYIVGRNDTLDSIALQYNMSKEMILEYNNLNSDMLFSGMELLIPLCKSTPQYTTNIPGNTSTIPPITKTILPEGPE